MGSAMSSPFRAVNAWLHYPTTLRSFYLLGWGFLFGANIWNSFIGGVIAFKSLPRQQFGHLQARQVPYFFALSALGSLGLLTLDIKLRPALLRSFRDAPLVTLSALNTLQFWSSTAGLAVITGSIHAVNGLVIGPKATEIMYRRHRLEKEEPRVNAKHPSETMRILNAEFSRLHGWSSGLNTVAAFTTGLIGWKIGSAGLGPKGPGGLGVTA